MRKLLLGLTIITSFAACQLDRSSSRVSESDLDSLDEVVYEDTFGVETVTEALPLKDGLFDDFVYRFMQDSLLQLNRISFPLSHWNDGHVTYVDKSSWRYDSIYPPTDEYTLIFDGREVVERVCDSLVKKATVEIVDLRQNRVKMYNFNREDEKWLLKSIDEHFFSQDNNHGFFTFYSQFANDEAFQLSHVHDPFYFKTYDADNAQEIEGWVSSDLWVDYRTYLPSRKLINTIYDDERPSSAYRTFLIGSPSSGLDCTLVFKRTNGRWELVRLEN